MTDETEKAGREPLPGEAEYVQARQMSRRRIPDFEADREYLELLGKAAALGFPRALVKLGDYAMRRMTLVEAYYWHWKARRRGVRGLDVILRRIRRSWMAARCPTESFNRNPLFTDETAAVALALLDLMSSRNRTEAQAFLGEHAPDLVE